MVGFTDVFTLLTYAAGQLGRTLLVHARTIEVVAGVPTVVWGSASQARRSRVCTAHGASPGRRKPAGWAPILGAAFALSWTSSLTLTLTAVLGLAAVQGSAGRAILLAAAYALGIGLPFLGFGFGYGRLLRLASLLRRQGDWVTRIGGALLVTVALALVTGAWTVHQPAARHCRTRADRHMTPPSSRKGVHQ